jgi:hypothetical protein
MAVREDIYTDIIDKVKTVVDSKYIFLETRPDNISNQSAMSKFVVVSLPTAIRDVAAGNHKLLLNTRGLLSLFVRSKSNNTLNVHASSSFEDAVMSLFPISGDKYASVNPVPMMRGSDKNGFHVTEISFEIHSKKHKTKREL